ncbi:helix-turn-helix domain-containing protein [Pseudomonas japonica]|uniref:helix-turn-helix domain-containing protein n=1 Tax=Pseudomonas japonica TaxID=256466 RepID=UPI00280BFBFF|nr:helix-turn-helix domain-containing protein [Pseudomonas japonica]MBA1243539.1 helix-turn-helix domain-containing protein [Pseudomonas japonica]
MRVPPPNAVPTFKLYGAGLDWPIADLLHCETISSRSRVFHWEIRPHRHADLYQLLYLHRGEAQIEVEGQRQTVRQPTLQFLPPLAVHGFRFSENVEGYVVTLAAPWIDQLRAQAGMGQDLFKAPVRLLAGNERSYLYSLFSALQREYEGPQPGREQMLHALANVALIWLGRRIQQHRAAGQAPERGSNVLARYQQQVEATFREQPSVERLAHRVGVSVPQLNSLCRRLAGQSPLQIIHQRMLLEAKRNLTYTSMTINQIADSLGFADPAYFARFFRRLSGQSPRSFRDGLGLGREAAGGDNEAAGSP